MKANFKIKNNDEDNEHKIVEDKNSTDMTEEEFDKKGINMWTYRSKQK